MEGYIALDIIEGPVRQAQFHEFLRDSLVRLPTVREIHQGYRTDSERQFPLMTPYPGPRSVVVLDNCPIHKGQEIVDMFRERGTPKSMIVGHAG